MAGNSTSERFVFDFGVFNKNIDAATNSEGDTNQGCAVYALKFSKAERVLG
jgi:hypothetical protein